MTRFQLSLRTKLERTPRAVQLESLFDVPRATESEVAFDFELPLFDDGAPDWSVGLIVGPSGAGKSSVARELFGDAIVAEYDWHRSLWNSEVGASSFGVTTFLYDAICGNHIVWGAKNVTEIKIRHVGDANKRRAFREVGVELTRYADESANETEAQIIAARKYVLGASKEEAVDSLLKLLGRKVHVSQKVLGDAYDAAELADRYGAPGTVWGMVNGITEVSQRTAHADERVKLDRVAGRVMDLVF